MFMVINGSLEDKQTISLGDDGDIPSTTDVLILGTPLSDRGNIQKDLNMHLELRFKNCIKFFNFIRANKCAPIAVKLKVLF